MIAKKDLSKWIIEFKKYEHMLGQDYIKPGMPFGNGVQWWARSFTMVHLAVVYYILVFKELNLSRFVRSGTFNRPEIFKFPEIIETINKFFVYKSILAAIRKFEYDSEPLARLFVLLLKAKTIYVPLDELANPMFDLSRIVISDEFSLIMILIKKITGTEDYNFIRDVLSRNESYKSNNLGRTINDKFTEPAEIKRIEDEEIQHAIYWLCNIGIVKCEKEIMNFIEG